MKTTAVTVVLAWTETGIEIVRTRRTDLGERPVTREIKVPKAAVWVNSGDRSDVEKAKAYASRETDYTIHVIVYPTTEKNPLDRARRDVLKA